MTLVLTGLDIESKAAAAQAQLFDALGGKERFDEVDVRLLRFDQPDAPTNAQATAHLQITVKARDSVLAAASSPVRRSGCTSAGTRDSTPRPRRPTPPSSASTGPPSSPPRSSPSASRCPTERQCLSPGDDPPVTPAKGGSAPLAPPVPGSGKAALPREPAWTPGTPAGAKPPGGYTTTRAPLGLICGARSGDKGGNANVGLWTMTDVEYAWLRGYLSTERFRQLLPEAAGLPVQRYELPNLRAVNFVVVGLLGDGVASSARPDPQAKGLGEYVRSRYVDLPASSCHDRQPGPAPTCRICLQFLPL